ncbi:serine/threonine protein kinase [Colletotrichum tabaci]|uniref:Serine/threonine protein kinase n=1 Tax=Colletotrichum tabaci TaxID=1209068 RepID=A0AAV9TJ30_9PEZI
MAPLLFREGCIQVLAHTPNSVIYAVDTDSEPGHARDTSTVLKGWAVWYKGSEPLGPVRPAEEADAMVRREAAIYDALGKYDRILDCVSLEVAVLEGAGPEPKAWALRLERAPGGSLRQYLYDNPSPPPAERIRLSLATQFAQGLSHVHSRNVVWSNVSTRNALLFDGWHLKLCDFGTSSLFEDYDHDWWGAESRYTPPGPQANAQVRKDVRVDTIRREIFALGSAIYEIVEWKVPYGSEKEVPLDEVHRRLIADQWPELDENNPAKEIINRCWAYEYDSAQDVVHDLQSLLESSR